MDASLRSLDIIHKDRELNFQKNEKLREITLNSVQDNLEFGNKARDFFKSLPTMAITLTAGSIALPNLLLPSSLTEPHKALFTVLIGFSSAAVGFLVQYGFKRAMKNRTRMLYIKEDYERSLYYDQYVHRVSATMLGLLLDIGRIHQAVFGEPYPYGDLAEYRATDFLPAYPQTHARS